MSNDIKFQTKGGTHKATNFPHISQMERGGERNETQGDEGKYLDMLNFKLNRNKKRIHCLSVYQPPKMPVALKAGMSAERERERDNRRPQKLINLN